MQQFILRRVFQAIIVLFVVSMVIFAMARLSGNPLDVMLPAEATQTDRDRLSSELGLDKPLPTQYVIFLGNVLHGDFGESIRFRRPAIDVIIERFPATLRLGGLAALLILVISLPIGVYSATHRGTKTDLVVRGFAVLGQSMPQFWTGIVLILIFAVWLRLTPASGMGGPIHYLLPVFTLGYYGATGVTRITRSAMLEVLDSEYIKLARAKGLHESIVIWKHAFKNSLVPILTFAALIFVRLLHGSVVTETVFAWPGIGRLAVESVDYRDYAVIQTVVLFSCIMYVIANLAVDILYAYVNPKIRYGN